jgi:hypothetical protein
MIGPDELCLSVEGAGRARSRIGPSLRDSLNSGEVAGMLDLCDKLEGLHGIVASRVYVARPTPRLGSIYKGCRPVARHRLVKSINRLIQDG